MSFFAICGRDSFFKKRETTRSTEISGIILEYGLDKKGLKLKEEEDETT
jgi:hypothetical protein